jgi:uncharacterized protein YggE
MLRDLKIPFFTVLFIFLGFIVFTKVFGPIPFSLNSVTTTKQNFFSVNGTGEATAIPDTAQLSLGVSKTGASVAEVQTQVNTIINKITEDLKQLGVAEKDIKTTNYSVNPNYDYTNGSQRVNGYVVNADIQVKIKPLDKANQAIDIATKDGATDVGGIQFVLEDAKQKELEEQARKEAIDAAKAKATSLSKISGIKLGKIIDIQVDEAGGAQPRPYAMKTAGLESAEDSATELSPGENKVTSNVTISYETY